VSVEALLNKARAWIRDTAWILCVLIAAAVCVGLLWWLGARLLGLS
jgi:hypothetical protein